MIENSDKTFYKMDLLKNGTCKFQFIEQEVYKILYLLGYRFVRIERKPFFYYINSKSQIQIVKKFTELRDAFAGHLKNIDLPKKELDELLNTFYAKRPIKRNGVLENCLTDSPEPSIYLIEEIKRQKRDK